MDKGQIIPVLQKCTQILTLVPLHLTRLIYCYIVLVFHNWKLKDQNLTLTNEPIFNENEDKV